MPTPIDIEGLVGDVSAATGNAQDVGVVATPTMTVQDIADGTGVVVDTTNYTPINSGTGSSVADGADVVGGVDPATVSAGILSDPAGFLGEVGTLSDNVVGINPDTVGTNIDGSNFQNQDTDALNSTLANVAPTVEAGSVAQGATNTYNTAKTVASTDSLMSGVRAEQTEVSTDSLVNIDTLDMDGLATGINSDGTVNKIGQSLNTVYTQNMSTVVDTTTLAGKMLAQELGEGNYLDAKSTVAGQLEILQKQFVDPVTGEPRIPAFAAGAAKGVQKMMALSGVTGTAAMGALSSAVMESILPIANADSKFFQTLTVKNLDARNTQALNTANILAKMNVADLDARMTQAVTNAKAFIAYDMANLDNRQQTTMLKTQFRQQAIMEDAKQDNVKRQFVAESSNNMDMFYDELGSQITRFNATQRNAMSQFVAGEANDMSQFNSELENNREQYYKTMQYQVDSANAKWRQDITVLESEQTFEAAAIDVKNIVGLSSEALNNIWDRTDALLDYAWKEGESAKDRNLRIFEAKLGFDISKYQTDREYKAAKTNGILGAIGTGIGIFAALSDIRLKDNVEYVKTLPNGVDLYTWEWNETAIAMGAGDNPTMGVVAQELIKIKPESVEMGEDGYLRVNYDEVFA